MSETIRFHFRDKNEYLHDEKPVTGTQGEPGNTLFRLARSLVRRLWWLVAGAWLLLLCVLLLRSRQLTFLLGRHYDDMREAAATRGGFSDYD